MLKKIIHKARYVRVLILVFSLFLNYESSFAQKFTIGLKGGPLASWCSFGDKEDKEVFSRKLKLGYGGALLIDFPLQNQYNVILEGGYSKRGRILLFNNDSWKNNSTYQFFDMVMVLRKSFNFMLRKNVKAQGFVNMGPEINYWNEGKGKLVVAGNDYNYEMKYNEEPSSDYNVMYMNSVNRWLFNIAFGVGMKAPIKPGQHLITELRFSSGHTYLSKDKNSFMNILGYEDTLKTNLKTISLTLAYTLDIDIQKSKKGKSTFDKKKM